MPDGLFFFAHTLSPLHAGTGQSLGKVDLPIEREKHTEYPCVFATGFKGALRKYCEKDNQLSGIVPNIFGNEDATNGSGGAIFTDLKILLFPVRSSKGSFKWTTCPAVLKRFKRDYRLVFGEEPPSIPGEENPSQVIAEEFDPEQHILLEDFMLPLQINGQGNFCDLTDIPLNDVYVISDELFKYLVNNATQIIARNQLTENKTSNNLWYEEALPAETILYSFILPALSNDQDISPLAQLNGQIVQIGGNETVGQGLTELIVKQPQNSNQD